MTKTSRIFVWAEFTLVDEADRQSTQRTLVRVPLELAAKQLNYSTTRPPTSSMTLAAANQA
ncbi:MAG: hypothetical protein EON59_10975 [Alphaproteobacteria bacterium]|nr:MAG: hypothetical protein EON59_10975 [Alphaproteobacteria bacterium]